MESNSISNNTLEIELEFRTEREGDFNNGNYELELLENGKKFKNSFHVNKIFYPKINGTDSSTKKGLETATNTEIITGEQNIEIIGSSKQNVIECRKRIEKIIQKEKHKSSLTHFLSIPCNVPEIQAKFEQFKNDILNDQDIEIDPLVFQNPLKLHQTILPMTLSDPGDHSKAIEYLQMCKQEIIDPYLTNCNKKLELKINGIGIMNDNPKKASVLFAKIECDEFQDLCNRIMDFYTEKLLVVKEYDRVKLHVTLMNSVFIMRKKRKDPNEQNRKRKFRDRDLKFDATKILEKYGNYNFGTFDLDEIHLSSINKVREDGFYKPSSVIKLY